MRSEIIDLFNWHVMVELPDGTCRKLTREERFDPDAYLPEGTRIYRRTGLDSQGASTTVAPSLMSGTAGHFPVRKIDIGPFPKKEWIVWPSWADWRHSSARNRSCGRNTKMKCPGRRINNVWSAQMYPSAKSYVVETSTKAIQRCLLMTTDPGDLVLDPYLR